MARLVKWGAPGVTGAAAVLGGLTHNAILMICLTLALFIAFISLVFWALSKDRRVERANVLLRGEWPAPMPVPREEVTPGELDDAGSAGSAGLAPPGVETEPPQLDSQARREISDYAGQLRESGRSDLADIVERLVRALPRRTS